MELNIDTTSSQSNEYFNRLERLKLKKWRQCMTKNWVNNLPEEQYQIQNWHTFESLTESEEYIEPQCNENQRDYIYTERNQNEETKVMTYTTNNIKRDNSEAVETDQQFQKQTTFVEPTDSTDTDSSPLHYVVQTETNLLNKVKNPETVENQNMQSSKMLSTEEKHTKNYVKRQQLIFKNIHRNREESKQFLNQNMCFRENLTNSDTNKEIKRENKIAHLSSQFVKNPVIRNCIISEETFSKDSEESEEILREDNTLTKNSVINSKSNIKQEIEEQLMWRPNTFNVLEDLKQPNLTTYNMNIKQSNIRKEHEEQMISTQNVDQHAAQKSDTRFLREKHIKREQSQNFLRPNIFTVLEDLTDTGITTTTKENPKRNKNSKSYRKQRAEKNFLYRNFLEGEEHILKHDCSAVRKRQLLKKLSKFVKKKYGMHAKYQFTFCCSNKSTKSKNENKRFWLLSQKIETQNKQKLGKKILYRRCIKKEKYILKNDHSNTRKSQHFLSKNALPDRHISIYANQQSTLHLINKSIRFQELKKELIAARYVIKSKEQKTEKKLLCKKYVKQESKIAKSAGTTVEKSWEIKIADKHMELEDLMYANYSCTNTAVNKCTENEERKQEITVITDNLESNKEQYIESNAEVPRNKEKKLFFKGNYSLTNKNVKPKSNVQQNKTVTEELEINSLKSNKEIKAERLISKNLKGCQTEPIEYESYFVKEHKWDQLPWKDMYEETILQFQANEQREKRGAIRDFEQYEKQVEHKNKNMREVEQHIAEQPMKNNIMDKNLKALQNELFIKKPITNMKKATVCGLDLEAAASFDEVYDEDYTCEICKPKVIDKLYKKRERNRKLQRAANQSGQQLSAFEETNEVDITELIFKNFKKVEGAKHKQTVPIRDEEKCCSLDKSVQTDDLPTVRIFIHKKNEK